MRKKFSPFYKDGLTEAEVQVQIQNGYKNNEPEKITKSTRDIIRDNVFTLFNLYNFIIAFALILVGAYRNVFFILIILINIAMGLFQEFRAKRMVEELSVLTMPKARVVRDGKEIEIATEDLVLDDIVIYTAGHQVNTDSILKHGVVEVNESMLTGETDAILKTSGDMLFSGSYLVSGKCYAQVEHVGLDNYATKLAHEAKKHKQVFSELLRSMQKVTKFTSYLIIPLGIFLFIEAYLLRHSDLQASVVVTAAALLGMLPKGLLLLISISLGTGVVKLAQKKILVQELYSLESLAHVDMLCLDKTGTITEGKMHVSAVTLFDQRILTESFEHMMQQFLGAVDDNNATFEALATHFGKKESKQVVATIPFSSERKWSSASFADIGTVLLGAPERLLPTGLPETIQQEVEKGGRVLVIAHSEEIVTTQKLPKKITPLATVLLLDPIRENAAQTLAYFREEGVHVKIISGDNPVAVSGIAEKAGFKDYQAYLDMSTIAADADLKPIVAKYDIFGRVSPQQKKALVLALKELGHTVAMTGDGVNDVLALREADCSIAIAEGSDAAKQIAQLVLLDSDFASLPNVVLEGRRVVNNVTKVASVFFIKTIYSILLSVLCVLLNVPFPFLPIQITIIDIFIEGYPAFFMSFEENGKKITGRFLENVIRNAMPNALTIIIMLFGIFSFINFLPFEINQLMTICYYLIGYITILRLFYSSYPFNTFRLLINISVCILFFGVSMLFANFLHLEVMTFSNWLVFGGLAIVSTGIEHLLRQYLVKPFFEKRKFTIK